ncbi:uncharacterized protein BX663DRAFT_548675 [Cokeromyces recurvatus]|uniref:uncharacterized protein n=1 Tax=Cokeromyces recurvatus TaxID=90255 RepID=UPI00221E6864|nr:uncharacterized protein BX663DRAFT_548675 [Cokeromyces recurvatus]KAI7906500.1 hypothetical protein BX663DRAFT_548675 [Cokeromyces recurvatus]
MGNNISSSKNDSSLRGPQYIESHKSSIKNLRISSSTKNNSGNKININNNNTSKDKINPIEMKAIPIEPVTAINIGKRSSSEGTYLESTANSDRKQKVSIEIDRDKLTSPSPERYEAHNRRIKSSQQQTSYYRQSKHFFPPDQHGSTFTATSGFSSHFGEQFHFSVLADSAITDLTNVSSFSFNSFFDKLGDDNMNNYIMATPDLDFIDNTVLPLRSNNIIPSLDYLSTADEILELLTTRSDSVFDILTSMYGSERMKSDVELQREASQAVETWSLRHADDMTAKMMAACCKLCGWGTTKDPKEGFMELQALAKRDVWEAYYYLGHCYLFGVVGQQMNEGSYRSSSYSLQPVDHEQAIYWYRKLIESPTTIQSERIQLYIAEAKLRIAAIHFTTGKMNKDNLQENIDYLKESVSAGNRKSEFSFGFLIETGVIDDKVSAKEYYTQSANKGYTPSQIQLALILLKENSSEAISWLKKASRLGDPRAFYYLGECYEFGNGVQADPILAVQYYQNAADRYSHPMAGFRLGLHYLHGGLNLLKDNAKAFYYLERAAKSGYPDAQYLIGMMYRDGKVPSTTRSSPRMYSNGDTISTRHKKEAFRWIRRAALQDMHTAITQMANFYEEGVGCPVNYSLAEEYYEIAVSKPGKHLPSAQQTYARFLHKNGHYQRALDMYLYASGMKQSLLNTYPPSDIISRTAKRMVALFYLDEKDTTTPFKPKEAFDILTSLTHLPGSDADAEYWIAVCHEEGVGDIIPKNLSLAYKHYVISANLGSSDSQFQVGHMLCKGIGVKEDRMAAFEWLQKSAEKNNPKALYYIGIYYYNGYDSIKCNYDKACYYFKRAAELGHTESMVSYAQICQEKLKNSISKLSASEIETLRSDSLKWYSRAAKENHITGLRELGRLYGAKGEFKTSMEFYVKAANLNDALSALFLGGYYENGQGVTQDKQTALKFYMKAIELGQSTALFAVAELYEKLQDYEKAYIYYERVTKDTRIPKTYKSRKTSLLKMALYSLNYDPNTIFSKSRSSPLAKQNKFESIPSLLSKSESFNILMKLATEDNFHEAYNWIAECYKDGRGVIQDISESLKWRMKACQGVTDAHSTLKLTSICENDTKGVQTIPI